jgi:NitT/TauT family transport system permease protein
VLPPPGEVWEALVSDRVQLARDLGQTAWAALAGYAGAGLAGWGLAVALLSLPGRRARTAVDGLLSLQAVPIIAVVSVFALYLSPGVSFEAAVVGFVVLPTVTAYAYRGLVDARPEAVDLMATYNASGLQVLRKLRAPMAVPFVFTALRYAVIVAMVSAVTSEIMHGASGLGAEIVNSLVYYHVGRSWASLLILSAFTLGWYAAVSIAEREVAPWLERFRA